MEWLEEAEDKGKKKPEQSKEDKEKELAQMKELLTAQFIKLFGGGNVEVVDLSNSDFSLKDAIDNITPVPKKNEDNTERVEEIAGKAVAVARSRSVEEIDNGFLVYLMAKLLIQDCPNCMENARDAMERIVAMAPIAGVMELKEEHKIDDKELNRAEENRAEDQEEESDG